MAEGHDYFRLGAMAISPDERLLAYSLDCDGSERFTVHIRDLTSGELLPDTIPARSPLWCGAPIRAGCSMGLANDQWRTDNVRLHWLGSDVGEDIVCSMRRMKGSASMWGAPNPNGISPSRPGTMKRANYGCCPPMHR